MNEKCRGDSLTLSLAYDILSLRSEGVELSQGFYISEHGRPMGEAVSLAAGSFTTTPEGGFALEAPMKTCKKCGLEYPATTEHFYASSTCKYGLASRCKPCHREDSRQWRKANPEKNREHSRRWQEANPDYIRQWRVQPQQKLSGAISNGMRRALKSGKDGKHWESLVGYTLEDLMAHLESQFTKGMTWDNFGAWHVDHRRPISHFNFESPDDPEFLECWSLWNLQPLWAFDNLSKNNKCDEPPLPLICRGIGTSERRGRHEAHCINAYFASHDLPGDRHGHIRKRCREYQDSMERELRRRDGSR